MANLPKLERKRDGYDLLWPEGIRMELRRVRRAHDDLLCELLIADVSAGADLIHFSPRINLSATETLARLGRQLSERVNYINWADCLTQLVFIVIQSERLGVPPVAMAEVDEPIETGHLVQNWILPTLPSTLFGLGGTGKTYLGLTLLTAAFHGLPFLVYFPQRPLRVAMWDYENNEQLTRRRLGRIARGLAVPVANVIYRHLELALSEYEEMLAHDIEKYNLDVAMLDSFGLATGGSQNKDELVLATYATLRHLGIATLIIDHESKESNRADSSSFAIGSVYKHNSSRITWHVKATKESQEDGELFLRLTNAKANEDARLKPVGVRLHFTPESVRATRLDLSDLPSDLTEGMPLRQRILLELKSQGQAMSTKELVEILGENANAIGKRLGELAKDGKVTRLQEGGGRSNDSTWGLRSEFE